MEIDQLSATSHSQATRFISQQPGVGTSILAKEEGIQEVKVTPSVGKQAGVPTVPFLLRHVASHSASLENLPLPQS